MSVAKAGVPARRPKETKVSLTKGFDLCSTFCFLEARHGLNFSIEAGFTVQTASEAKMIKIELDPEREARISSEIVVDCYSAEEQAMGWHAYLDGAMVFPFAAKWGSRHHDDPEALEAVEVLGLASPEDCFQEMLVEIRYVDAQADVEVLTIPLANITPELDDEQTLEAIADWHYWTDMGYSLDEGDSEEE
jgi:hypothetical protein